MSVDREAGALVVISAVGLVPVVVITDAVAKNLGLSAPTITSERGRGRYVLLWNCASDIAGEIKLLVSHLPPEISGHCEIYVSLNSSGLRIQEFIDSVQ